MRTNTKYTRELKKQFGYLATWLPSTPVSLGDVGIVKRGVFTRLSNLNDFGISFEIEKDSSKSDIDHSSKGAVSISLKAAGTTPAAGSTLTEVDAGITIEFSKENAILFKANGTVSPSIKDQIKLGDTIKKLYKEGKWNIQWVVVTEVVEAESATIIISGSSKGKVELKAEAEVKLGELDIADADAKLGLSFSRDLSTSIIAKESLTPLFKASRIKEHILKKPTFTLKGVEVRNLITPAMALENDEVITFGEADYDLEEE